MTRLFCATLLLVSWQAVPQPLAVTNTFSNSTVADAEEINQNFADIIDGVNGKLTTDNDDPYNTAVGFNMLSNITTGFGNTAIGYESLAANTEGGRNTASGFRALLNNLTGYQNTATGYGRSSITQSVATTPLVAIRHSFQIQKVTTIPPSEFSRSPTTQ